MTSTPSLTQPQLVELMGVLGGSDAVELKLTVPDSHHRSTAESLDLDPIAAEIRQIVFFDTPDLALNRSGLVVRARRMRKGVGDTVVKLRPVVPGQIPGNLRESGKVAVEVDAMPGGFVCSASMKGKSSAAAVRQVILGRDHPGSLFSKHQKAFFELHAPEGLRMRDLAVLGPINVLKLKFAPEDLGRKMVAEMWLYPDGSRILELSTKCETGMAFQVAAESRAFLAGHGIDLDGEQQTKTKTALEYFASALRSEPESSGPAPAP
jgi:hypothetical protein